MRRLRTIVILTLAGIAPSGSAGCASHQPPQDWGLRQNVVEFRQRSTRRFMTGDENMILSACAGVLQDLGFIVEDSETDLGFILATKDRSAVDNGQVVGKVFAGLLLRTDVPVDRNQTFRVSIVTRPAGQETAVRVTFQRLVWNDHNQLSKLEPIEEPAVYQEFFDRLSESVFLEAHHL